MHVQSHNKSLATFDVEGPLSFGLEFIMADASALAAMEYAIENMTLAGPNHDLAPNVASKRPQQGHISRYSVATESCHNDIKYNATSLHTI